MVDGVWKKLVMKGEAMSRPRYFWYGNVKRMISQYPAIKDQKSEMAIRYTKAIESTFDELDAMSDGKERKEAVELVYIKRLMTVEGAAGVLHYNKSKIQRWLSDFVNDVGKKVGF